MRSVLYFCLLTLTLAACTAAPSAASPQAGSTAVPPVLPSPTALLTQTPLPAAATAAPTETAVAPQSSPIPNTLPDLSGVTLFETTPLMDPAYFQVGLAGWPQDAPAEMTVLVGGEVYQCDLLFPAEAPDRLYCWGAAPPRGAQVSVQIVLADELLLEIPFTVP